MFRNQNLHNIETYIQLWVVSVRPVFVLLGQGEVAFNHSRGTTFNRMGSVQTQAVYSGTSGWLCGLTNIPPHKPC